MSDGKMFQQLQDRIYMRDRVERSVYPAWDTINAIVNEVYGIDLGDALNFWETQHGRQIIPSPADGTDAGERNKVIVVISDGAMQGAYANCDVDVDLYDFDNAAEESEEEYKEMEGAIESMEKSDAWHLAWPCVE